MAPVDDSIAGELPVPEVGRRDGVGVCASIGMLLSIGGVALVEVKEEVEGYRVSLYSKLEDWGHWVKADVIACGDFILLNTQREMQGLHNMLYTL